jgi:hypothetical protein
VCAARYLEGETKGTMNLNLLSAIGEGPFTVIQLFAHLVFGWPAYLLTGATVGAGQLANAGGPIALESAWFQPSSLY